MKEKITFNEILKEYPNLKKLSNKYPKIKEIDLYIEIESRNRDKNHIIYKADYKGKISQHWQIRDNEITWLGIEGSMIEGSESVLALGSWYFIKNSCDKMIDWKGDIHFMTLLKKGQEFWARMLGFGSFEVLVKYVKNVDGTTEKSESGESYNIHMPVRAFEKQINARWKK